jgi:hypothetical protein
MGLLDSVVGQCFRDEKNGRVVVYTGDRSTRGYLVKSEAEELRIRSFLKMFCCAQFAILLLGYFLASEWSRELAYALGRPAAHLFRSACISAGIYLLVVGLPYFLLWKSYNKARLSFVSAQDEVQVSRRRPGQRQIFVGVALAALAVLIMFGIILLIRSK